MVHFLSDGAFKSIIAIILSTSVICSVAIYNRFPLMFDDTSYYLRKAFTFSHSFTHADTGSSLNTNGYNQFQPPIKGVYTNPLFLRPVGYATFLVPFANRYLLYLIPFAQSLIIAYLIWLIFRILDRKVAPLHFIAIFVALCLFSSLPWITGQIMPDIFSSIVILSFFVLAFGAEKLKTIETIFIFFLLAGAISTHLSYLVMFIILTSSLLVYWLIFDRSVAFARRSLLLVVGPFVLAVSILAGSNFIFTGRLVISESSNLFYLAHLVGDGTAQKYLNERCLEVQYLLCAEKENLPADGDHFLWAPDGIWSKYQYQDTQEFLAQADIIVDEIMHKYFLLQLRNSLANFGRQLVSFGLDPTLIQPMNDPFVFQLMEMFGEPTLSNFLASRQFHQALPLPLASRLHVAGVLASLLVLAAALPGLAVRREKRHLLFVATIVLGIAANAFAVGALAMVHERYQSRVVWLLPLAALIVARQAFAERRSG